MKECPICGDRGYYATGRGLDALLTREPCDCPAGDQRAAVERGRRREEDAILGAAVRELVAGIPREDWWIGFQLRDSGVAVLREDPFGDYAIGEGATLEEAVAAAVAAQRLARACEDEGERQPEDLDPRHEAVGAVESEAGREPTR